ncbi:MAG: hypothetical protein JNG83_03480 [Opitutaceae bacterium]|nr:hypothetical protein [Opitutaceae bacterium]
MNRLFAATPVTLGAAAAAGCTLQHLGDGQWAAAWRNPAGVAVVSTGSFAGGAWTAPVPVAGDYRGDLGAAELSGGARAGWRLAPRAAGAAPGGGPERMLASAEIGGRRVALRAGSRVIGVKPSFPSAAVVVAVQEPGGWTDIGFTDDLPDAAVAGAALAGHGSRAAAAYVVATGAGSVCRVMEFLPAAPAAAPGWRRLPDYPQPPGMAGVLSGMHGEVVIAAGGANFPDKSVWDGGKKVTHDTIYVLLPGEQSWRPAGRLPEPRAYAAVVSLPDGVLAVGGENPDRIFQDTLLLRWDGAKVCVETVGPALPAPVTAAVSGLLDDHVYIAGGYAPGAPRLSTMHFWRLDVRRRNQGWERLPAWDGPARAQAAMAVLDGALYLVSGLEMVVQPDGTTRGNYLADAYRYRPGRGWERLPDPPWSCIAPPSPAPVTTSPPRVFMLGGVDGRQQGKLPRDVRLPDDILYFDVVRHEWRLWNERWPDSVVTVPAMLAGKEWYVISGEIMGGVRTTNCWAWRIEG